MADIKLVLLLKEILAEIGDLNNIQPYSYNKLSETDEEIRYKFIDIDDNIATVKFQTFESIEYSQESLPSILEDKLSYNVSFDIEDELLQYKKINLDKLNRIFKTIHDIILEFLNEYSPDFLFIKGTSDYELFSPEFTQKDKIYYNIIVQNLPSEYGVSIGKILGLNGIQLRKKSAF